MTEDVVVRLGRIRISPPGTLNHRQAQAPDITLDAISSTTRRPRLLHAPTSNAFRGHVALASNVSLGNARNQIAADSKIADFDLPSSIGEDIGGLDVPVDDVVVVFQCLETHDRREGYFAQDVLGHTALI